MSYPIMRLLLHVVMLSQIAVPSESSRDPLNEYIGKAFIFQSFGDQKEVRIAREAIGKRTGCDVAVQVRKVTYEKNEMIASLTPIGLPKVAGVTNACGRPWYEITVAVSEIPSSQDLDYVLRELLMTPEDYLAFHGKRFAAEASTSSPQTPDLKPLLTVEPTMTEEAGRKRAVGTVSLRVIVGPDGRVSSSEIVSGIGAGLDERSLAVLPLWRFEPVRREGRPAAARAALQFNFDWR